MISNKVKLLVPHRSVICYSVLCLFQLYLETPQKETNCGVLNIMTTFKSCISIKWKHK